MNWEGREKIGDYLEDRTPSGNLLGEANKKEGSKGDGRRLDFDPVRKMAF